MPRAKIGTWPNVAPVSLAAEGMTPKRRIYKIRSVRFNLLAVRTVKCFDPLINVANLLRVRLLLQKTRKAGIQTIRVLSDIEIATRS